ncbi:MAG: putative bifunctional diguanylate cyclase/phosphodiesterase [Acetobacteraceae bacterium]
MQHPTTPARQRLSWHIDRLGIGAIGALGIAVLAASVERAAGGGALITALAGVVAITAFLLGWLMGTLGEARRLAALLAENGRDVIARVRPDGTLAYISPAALSMLGYQPGALVDSPIAGLCHPDDAPALIGLLAAVPPQYGLLGRLFHLLHADGYFMPIELTLAPAGRSETVCVLRDVTRWQRAVAQAQRSERDYQLIAEHAGDMIVRVRPDRTRAYVSPSGEGVLGYPPEELRDIDFTTATHPDDRARVALAFDAFVRSGGQTTCRFRLRHKTRGFIWVESTWATQPTNQPDQATDVVAIVRDISERVAAEQQIAFLGRHDPLTGLANRALLAERTAQAMAELARGGLVAMLCFDLDLFKSVNDTLGHAAGDALLCQVAARITACVRPGDTVARLGGDEFAVLQPGLERTEDAGRFASRLLSELAAPFELEGQVMPVSASLGIAVAPLDGTDYAALLRKADAALYRAKADGRGRWHFFEPAMEARRAARERMVVELRQALACGEFRVHYMPLVALDTERIIGFEALLRWQHPKRGLLMPDAFVPLAEETGLIAPIGAWVLGEACADAALWPESIAVAVNLSVVQLREGTLARGVTAALAAAGLRAARLQLEVTESVLLDDSETILAELHALRAIGVRIALDDFGTGYSSFRYLRRFPFDKIKLEHSFVRDIAEAADALAIVRAVSGLGRSLGIATLAEGVETAAQRDLVRAEGYTEAQGFLYGRPGDLNTVRALLARHAPAPVAEAMAG